MPDDIGNDEVANLIARLNTDALCIQSEFCAHTRQQAARTLAQVNAGSFQLSCGCAWYNHVKVIYCQQHPSA